MEHHDVQVGEVAGQILAQALGVLRVAAEADHDVSIRARAGEPHAVQSGAIADGQLEALRRARAVQALARQVGAGKDQRGLQQIQQHHDAGVAEAEDRKQVHHGRGGAVAGIAGTHGFMPDPWAGRTRAVGRHRGQLIPAIDIELDHGERRGRKLAAHALERLRWSAPAQADGEMAETRVVPDQHERRDLVGDPAQRLQEPAGRPG